MNDLSAIKGLLTDYVRLLEKEHPTAARIVQLYANQEISQVQAKTDGDNKDQ